MYMFTCMNPIHMYRNKYEYVFVKQSCCYEKKIARGILGVTQH